MTTYKRSWLDNLEIQEQSEKAYTENYISKEELKTIKDQYKVGFYHPGNIIRIGLFILTFIVCIFSSWRISIAIGYNAEFENAFFICGTLSYIALVLFVKLKHHYKSGVDDALLWISAIFFTTAICMKDFSSLKASILIFILSVFLSIRYINYLISAIAYCSLICIIFFTSIKYGEFIKEAFPFFVMATCALFYLLIKKIKFSQSLRFYGASLLSLEIIILCIFYMAGNIYVVSEINNSIIHYNSIRINSSIGWFFWTTSFIIPVLYLYMGIVKKDIILLRVAILSIAALGFTIRYYYHLIPVETVLILTGIIVLFISCLLIQYLKLTRKGFIYKRSFSATSSALAVEGLLAGILPSHQDIKSGTHFGGGSGGGSGAGGTY